MLILGKVLDEDDPDAFRGTKYLLVHPTRFGHKFQAQKFYNILSFLIYRNLCGRFSIESVFCDNYR